MDRAERTQDCEDGARQVVQVVLSRNLGILLGISAMAANLKFDSRRKNTKRPKIEFSFLNADLATLHRLECGSCGKVLRSHNDDSDDDFFF